MASKGIDARNKIATYMKNNPKASHNQLDKYVWEVMREKDIKDANPELLKKEAGVYVLERMVKNGQHEEAEEFSKKYELEEDLHFIYMDYGE